MQEDLLGRSWHKFIPPGPYVDRALDLLAPALNPRNEKRGSASIQASFSIGRIRNYRSLPLTAGANVPAPQRRAAPDFRCPQHLLRPQHWASGAGHRLRYTCAEHVRDYITLLFPQPAALLTLTPCAGGVRRTLTRQPF